MTAGNLKVQMKCVPGGSRNMALVAAMTSQPATGYCDYSASFHVSPAKIRSTQLRLTPCLRANHIRLVSGTLASRRISITCALVNFAFGCASP